jgi:16S rRNA processing protein RimM
MFRDSLVVIGQALKSFGIKGEIKIRPFTETIAAFKRSPALIFDDLTHKVLRVRHQGDMVVVSLEGIDTREKACTLVGKFVKTEVKNLPPKKEDEYYWVELIGLKVFTKEGIHLGEITHITPTGANDVLHVNGPSGEVLLPMIDDVVIDVDVSEGKIIVDPLEGLIPNA